MNFLIKSSRCSPMTTNIQVSISIMDVLLLLKNNNSDVSAPKLNDVEVLHDILLLLRHKVNDQDGRRRLF